MTYSTLQEMAHLTPTIDLMETNGDQLPVLFEVHTPSVAERDASPAPLAALAAVESLLSAMPVAVDILRRAVADGKAFRVVFPPDAMAAYQQGTAHLMQTSTGLQPTMMGNSGILRHARVVGGPGMDTASGLSSVAIASVALPMLMATAASYAQQKKLEEALQRIEAAVGRIEQRLRDTEHGTCQAAERFLDLTLHAQRNRGVSPYLRTELAVHMQAVATVHESRLLHLERFVAQIGAAQTRREVKKGEAQPWVAEVADAIDKESILEELNLYMRSLIISTRLEVLAAACIADDGDPDTALLRAQQASIRLREHFYLVYRPLRPLAAIPPDDGLWSRIPGLGRGKQEAFVQVQRLVQRINNDVLPTIPEADEHAATHLDLPIVQARHLLAVVDAAA